MKKCNSTTYPERVLIFAILWTFYLSRKLRTEWIWSNCDRLACMHRTGCHQRNGLKQLSLEAAWAKGTSFADEFIDKAGRQTAMESQQAEAPDFSIPQPTEEE